MILSHNQSFLFRFIYLFYCWVGNTRSLTNSDLSHNLPHIFIKNLNGNAISYLFICLFVNINYLDNAANTIDWLTVTLMHTSPFVPPHHLAHITCELDCYYNLFSEQGEEFSWPLRYPWFRSHIFMTQSHASVMWLWGSWSCSVYRQSRNLWITVSRNNTGNGHSGFSCNSAFLSFIIW